jgi:hypothetical protein
VQLSSSVIKPVRPDRPGGYFGIRALLYRQRHQFVDFNNMIIDHYIAVNKMVQIEHFRDTRKMIRGYTKSAGKRNMPLNIVLDTNTPVSYFIIAPSLTLWL